MKWGKRSIANKNRFGEECFQVVEDLVRLHGGVWVNRKGEEGSVVWLYGV